MKDIRIMRDFIKLAYKIYPKMFYLLMLSAVINMTSAVFSTYAISIMVRFAENGVFEKAVMTGLMVAVADGIFFMLRRWITGLMMTAREAMSEAVNQAISKKIMSLPFSYLEDAHFLELKNNAMMGINNMGAVHVFFDGLTQIITNISVIIFLASIIATFDWRILLTLGLGIVMTVIVTVLSTKSQIRFFKDLLPINFRYGYYMNTLTDVGTGKDFRLYSVYETMRKKFKAFNDKIDDYFFKYEIKMAGFDFILSLIRYAVLAMVYIISGIKVVVMNMRISQFTLTCSAAISFSGAVSAIIEASSSFMRGVEYVKPIMDFMQIDDDNNPEGLVLDHFESLEFDHISFKYPNTDNNVLNDVSFVIHKNEKISIVGLNGAGKTTVVKLICRLYKPDKGEIRVNGHNIDDYSRDSYVGTISTVFQDYKLFNYSILDNIKPGLSESEGMTYAKKVGLEEKVNELPNGISSNIGKSYDKNGVELSGGQMQKLAIARALAKPSDLLIMDEPTSALDPLAEAEIYENFNALAENRTAIYISHRMSSSVFCDKILVLNEGRVEDFAAHKDLMKKKEGLYYKLFMTQAENYRTAE